MLQQMQFNWPMPDGHVVQLTVIPPDHPATPDDLFVPTAQMPGGDSPFGGETAGPVDPKADAVSFASVAADFAAASEPPIHALARRVLVNRLIARSGRSRPDVVDAVAQVEAAGPHPFMDWLLNGGFADIFKLILALLSGGL